MGGNGKEKTQTYLWNEKKMLRHLFSWLILYLKTPAASLIPQESFPNELNVVINQQK